MKIQQIQLKNFKRFKDVTLDFTDRETGLAQNLIVLIGMNGSGKTSVLQAIAATLGTATGRLKKPSDLAWPGFVPELVSINWRRLHPEVTLNVEFSKSELKAVSDLQQQVKEMREDLIPSAQEHLVSLRWQSDRVQANTAAELFQFKGREYAKQLSRLQGFQVFERVGTVFWYTDQRTSTSLTSEDPERRLEITEDTLRDRLSKWQVFHNLIETGKIKELRPGQKDLYAEMERAYQAIFAQRSFDGTIPREDPNDILSEPWFNLYDGNNPYEISEMSGGERAIFPMLVDFVNWNIHNSVILIDELELHLHPPLQQALLSVLPSLGKNNQFIITTHSDAVAQLVPEENIIRLDM
jgi:predicted ATPase